MQSEDASRPPEGTRTPLRERRELVVASGMRVPYPEPASTSATAIGKANRRANTKPERALRSVLHRRGLRFRKDHQLQASGLTVRADVAFTRRRVAVFVDGCFWHSCPEHGTVPKRNQEYWLPKLAGNRARDDRVNAALRVQGWEVVRIWEHEDPAKAADEIQDLIARRSDGYAQL